MPASLGSVTTSRFEHDPEAHKLHIEFEVAAAQSVYKADPVVLATNGKVQAAASGDSVYKLLGVSIHDGGAGDRVTISMKGYCVVNAEAAAASFDAGSCKLGAWNATTGLREYAAVTGADDAAKTALAVGFNLTQVTADGDAVMICLNV
jgi:hypothetical protein